MEVKRKDFLTKIAQESGFTEGIVKVVLDSTEKVLMNELLKCKTESMVLVKIVTL